MQMRSLVKAIALGFTVFLGSCSSTTSVEPLASTPAPSVPSPAKSVSKPHPSTPLDADELTSSNDTNDTSAAFPNYPDIGTLTSAQAGDVMCYTTVRDRQGQELEIGATFDLCDRQADLLNQTVRLVYSEETVADCQGAEPCGRSRQETLISDVVLLGQDWQVLSNGDWTVTVGRIESWSGVNGVGSLTYYGCDAEGRCLSLTDGFVVCRNGVCNMSWANGDHAYTLSSELTETGDDPTTLFVWQDGTERLRAENMGIVDSSDN